MTAAELAASLTELRSLLLPAEVVDVACLRGKDDLLLFVRPHAGTPPKAALHVVPGGARGRIAPTQRRFPRAAFATGPLVDALRQRLVGSTLAAAEALDGERVAQLAWERADGTRGTLVVELFGNRGLWAVLDGEGRMVAQSRIPHEKDRDLAPLAHWSPPPRRGARVPVQDEAVVRFAPPVLAAIDQVFTTADQAAEAAELHEACAKALERARSRLAHKMQGLQAQLESAEQAPRLRAEADLMLAYAHTVRRGQTILRVPDPYGSGEIELTLAADLPVVAQAQARYERARRLADGVAMAHQRLAEAGAQAAALAGLAQQLAAANGFEDLAVLHGELVRQRLVKEGVAGTGGTGPERKPSAQRGERAAGRKPTAAAGYRQFTSVEGYPILCGKTNADNDRLTLRTARGNDVWLHVGRGHAGSHVVVRLPKGKTASLETLLDAATIAVHFSKARGAAKAEVTYTLAKHVRKRKGSPAGQVVPGQTKTLHVRIEEDRLRRLLDSAGEDART